MSLELFAKSFNRNNLYSSWYSDIVLQNYHLIKEYLEEYNKCIMQDILDDYQDKIIKSSLITVVFSAMAIESFINDYIASYITDKIFNDDFDKLSIVSKLQLVSTLLWEKKLDKSKPFFNDLSILLKNRNHFIHNKSEKLDLDNLKIDTVYTDGNEEFYANIESYRNSSNIRTYRFLEKAKISIRAMIGIAELFDSNDNMARAAFHLLTLSAFPKDFKINIYKEIFPKSKYIQGCIQKATMPPMPKNRNKQ